MIFWTSLLLWHMFAAWLGAAVLGGVLAWAVARQDRAIYSFITVFMVFCCGLISALLPSIWKKQADTTYFKEASTFCGAPVKVLAAVRFAGEFKLGFYDSYLSPGNFKDVEFALRSKQTTAGSPLSKVSLVSLKRGEQPAADVHPVLLHRQRDSASLTIIDPRTGEILAYSSYLYAEDANTRSRYVGCDREKSGGTPRQLEFDLLFALVESLLPGVPEDSSRAKSTQRKRKFDIEPDTFHEIRDDCSKGLTLIPERKYSLDYRYLRSGDDLVVLFLDKDSWTDLLQRTAELAKAHRQPVLWQHFHPVITCKNYFSDDTKAGPVFHPNGYEEPVARIRGFGKQAYFPFDYGPYREVTCRETVMMGGVRQVSNHILKREGADLVIAEYHERLGSSATIAPLINCKGYFSSRAGEAPDVKLGAGAPREVSYSASKLLALGDGQYLGAQPGIALLQTPLAPKSAKVAAPAPVPASGPQTSAGSWRDDEFISSNPWPAKPRILAGFK